MIWLLFFLSGFSGLVYEVLWTRSLTLVFGNTVYATSTVLAAYMGGLALGAYALGRYIDRIGRPLLVYGILEAIVGVSALLFPLFLYASVPVLQFLYRSDNPTLLAVVRFGMAFLFLFIPTVAMGGTLPALSKLMAPSQRPERILAWLYGINTFGAVTGTIAAGFWFLPKFGSSWTNAIAVTINALIAVIAIVLGRFSADKEGRSAPEDTPVVQAPPMDRRMRIALIGFMLSGALALALEVLWTRSFLLVFGSTVYAFSIMLALFLLGIALGSALTGAISNKLGDPLLAFGIVQFGVGLITLHSVSRVNTLPSIFLDGLISFGFDWTSYLFEKIILTTSTLLPVAFLFGSAFPLVASMEVTREQSTGRQVGLMYASNTVGAILGSLAAGFVILPLLGLQRSLMLIALCAMALGVILTLTRRKGEQLRNRLLIAVLFVASGSYLFSKISPWDQKLLSAGVYFSPQTYMSPDQKHNVLNQALGDVRVVRYVEGLTSTVAVVDTPFGRVFRVDGKVEATSGFDDMRLQRMMGHLPMLLADRIERAVNIGLGAGTTVGSLLAHPLKELQVIELEKSVLITAREFSHLNHAALDDPRLQVVLNDGRNHLLLTDRKYEIITSDPFEPVVGGSASLYTYNHFMNARKSLAPRGIVCQYLPMYELSTHDFQMILRSFCRAFPAVTLWFTGFDTILIGSESALTLNFDRLKERMVLPKVKSSLQEIGIGSPVELLQTFVMVPSKTSAIKSGPVNTDQNAYIEFSAPRTHMVDTMQLHLKWLIDNYHPEELKITFNDSESKGIAQKASEIGRLAMEGRLYRYQGRYDEALQTLRKARELHPDNQVVLFEIATAVNLKATILLQNGKFDDAKILLDEAPRIGKAALDTYSNLATWAIRTGNPSQAVEFLHEALKQGPRVHHLNLKMAQAFKALRRPQEALVWCNKAIALNPLRPSAKLVKADLLLDLGDNSGALTQYEKVLSENPYSIGGEHWLIIGILRSQTNQIADARKAFEIATQITPLDPRPWYNLARTAQIEGDYDDAKAALDKATELDANQVRIWLAKDPVFKSNQ